jgi:hypothetical protein
VDNWCGNLALCMPHFATIVELNRPKFREDIQCLMDTYFTCKGYVHDDVRWQNIGVYKDCNHVERPILYDLGSVRRYNQETDVNWVNEAMLYLYPPSSYLSIDKLHL